MMILYKLLRISFLFLITTYATGSIIFYEPISGRKPPGSSRHIDPGLEKYVEAFEKEWGREISFPVYFNRLEDDTVGRCTTWIFNDRVVEIDSTFFTWIDDVTKEILIFHELGHCALKRYNHVDDKILFEEEILKAPKSIMSTNIFNPVDVLFYKKYRQYYMDELFGRLK